MREIKFRARFECEDGENRFLYLEIKKHITGEESRIIIPSDAIQLTEWEQYTGLKDKNGKEIYEGDVIKAILIDDDLLCMGEIVYDEIMSFFGLLNDAGITPLFRLSNCEIIRNIYENPELTK